MGMATELLLPPEMPELVCEQFGDRRPVSLRGWKESWGVSLEIHVLPIGRDAKGGGPVFEKTLRVWPPGVGAFGPGHAAWSMARGLPRAPGHDDLFWEATHAAFEAMFVPGGKRRRRTRPLRQLVLESASETMRALYGILRDLAIHAADKCIPELRHLAMHFSPHLRLRVYRELVEDSTSRLAQIVTTCPGALIFALGLLEQTARVHQDAGRRLLANLRGGRRLDEALDEALDGWLRGLEPLGSCASTPHMECRVQRVILGLGPAELARLLRQQRLLIRRAGTPPSQTQLSGIRPERHVRGATGGISGGRWRAFQP
jgi:hypothetical protein